MADNFPVMNDLEKEQQMKEFVLNRGYPLYLRLVSFYHKQGAENVLEIRRRDTRGGVSKTDKDD